ncbi:EscG/YscG/SsaH family type III secretion system needle protein co-chaperone, partial [Escherichia coli]
RKNDAVKALANFLDDETSQLICCLVHENNRSWTLMF